MHLLALRKKEKDNEIKGMEHEWREGNNDWDLERKADRMADLG